MFLRWLDMILADMLDARIPDGINQEDHCTCCLKHNDEGHLMSSSEAHRGNKFETLYKGQVRYVYASATRTNKKEKEKEKIPPTSIYTIQAV